MQLQQDLQASVHALIWPVIAGLVYLYGTTFIAGSAIAHERGGIRIMLDGAAAHNDHPLAQPFYFRYITVYSLDDDGS